MIYRRSLHATRGPYLVAPGVTISDCLFFGAIPLDRWFHCDDILAICDASGRSSKPAAYYQRLAIDLIVGHRGRFLTGMMLLSYPFYRRLVRPIVRWLK